MNLNTSIINYESLHYWLQTMENIILLEKLLKTNIETYQRTQDIQYLEYIANNATEIMRLIPLKEQYYRETFNSQEQTHTPPHWYQSYE